MNSFLLFVKQMAANPYLTIIVYFLSFLSVLLAILLYYKSRKIKIPLYTIKTNNIIADYISKISLLNVLYSGNQIDNLSVSKIAFWNNGNEPIKNNDIAKKDPLRIILKNNSKLLDAKIIDNINQANNFNLITSDNGSVIEITFDFIAKNEGVLIQVFHTGKTNNDISIEGTIIGGKKLSRIKLFFKDTKDRFVWLPIILLLFYIIYVNILSTYNMMMETNVPTLDKIIYILCDLAALSVVSALLLAMKNNNLPKGFDIFEENF